MSEREFHDWLSRRLTATDPAVLAGVGADDCAILNIEGCARLAVSTDTIVEGTHFLAEEDPLTVGNKAVCAALSDLAASGCRPRWGLVALTMRKGLGDRWAMRLMEGIASAARRYGLSIVGGDTTSVYGPTNVNLTVMGTPYAKEAIRRDGARAGDLLLVTGALGGSILGRHLRPEPRFAEIEKLLSLVPVHAAMDISDGLALDLSRMLAVSNVGATIEESEIPISPAAVTLSQTSGKTPLEHALGDGEDFELLLAVPAGMFEDIAHEWKKARMKTPISCIGRVEAATSMRIASRDGTVCLLSPTGYDHNF